MDKVKKIVWYASIPFVFPIAMGWLISSMAAMAGMIIGAPIILAVFLLFLPSEFAGETTLLTVFSGISLSIGTLLFLAAPIIAMLNSYKVEYFIMHTLEKWQYWLWVVSFWFAIYLIVSFVAFDMQIY